jgi:SAM-dependent methyltransferase
MKGRSMNGARLREVTQVTAPSNIEWAQWGESDPFWGVASHVGRKRGEQNPWTAQEFYELGANDWAVFRTRWDNYDRLPGKCIEIGCGAGRLTMHMARDFREVVGVDVSEGMLRVARTHVTTPNVAFLQSNGVELPVATSSADGVFSTHVFQHFDSHDLARANFAEVARILRPGATAMIHLPIYTLPRGLGQLEPLLAARRHLDALRASWRRRRGAAFMRWLTFSSDWIFETLPTLGFSDLEITVTPCRHPFVLMRRVPAPGVG